MGLGHCRYPTAGSSSAAESQPFFTNSPYGIVLGHNGNLVNCDKLRSEMYKMNHRHLNTSSDSEILLNVLAVEIVEGEKKGGDKPFHEIIFDAVEQVKLLWTTTTTDLFGHLVGLISLIEYANNSFTRDVTVDMQLLPWSLERESLVSGIHTESVSGMRRICFSWYTTKLH